MVKEFLLYNYSLFIYHIFNSTEELSRERQEYKKLKEEWDRLSNEIDNI